MKKILFISGARPNLIKLAPLLRYIKNKKNIKTKLLHTNQHSNKFLFRNICKDLEIGKPNYLINKIRAKNNISMISYFMNKISDVIESFKPNFIILFGDVDTTLAAGLASSKKNYYIFHVEAGLRSKDFKAQEEINRRVVDHIADINFCTTFNSLKNLQKEGLNKKSYLVGNIIFDNFFNLKKKIDKSKILKKLLIKKNDFILITIHRYQIINYKKKLKKLCELINKFSKSHKIIFSCHSRTKFNLKKYNLLKTLNRNVITIDPLNYTDFTKLLISSKLVITDSGGVHEEAFFHKKKCLILREKLEREEFVNSKNIIKINFNNYQKMFKKILSVNKVNTNKKIKYWDGKVAKRIYNIIKSKC
tara:strand:- start:11885 stop:12970 length:1086 start_codon:yes stop_codon:yes gene_type:complete